MRTFEGICEFMCVCMCVCVCVHKCVCARDGQGCVAVESGEGEEDD